MPVYRSVVRDKSGDVVPLVTVEVFDSGTTLVSSIYSDEALSTAKDNPFVSEADGTVEFYAAHGQYDLDVSRTGIDDLSYDDVDLFDSDVTAQGDAGGDLDGTYPNPDVVSVQGNAVETGVPTDEDVLQWSTLNSQWEHVSAAALAGAAGGDLSGTYPNPTVDALQGSAVDATAPSNGDALIWSTGNAAWEPTAATPTSGAASGDLAGTFPSPTVDGIQGTAIAAAVASPTSGDFLKYDGVDWDLQPDSGYIKTAPSGTQTIVRNLENRLHLEASDSSNVRAVRLVDTTSGDFFQFIWNTATTPSEGRIDISSLTAMTFTDDGAGDRRVEMDNSFGLFMVADPVEDLEAATKQYVDAQISGSGGNVFLASGDEMLWGGSSVPSGFSVQSGANFNDRVPFIVTTAGATKDTGGNWAHSNGLTITVNGHTLTTAEMPSHTHSVTVHADNVTSLGEAGVNFLTDLVASAGDDSQAYTSASTGSGNSHSHTASASSDSTWRPLYRTFAVIRKT